MSLIALEFFGMLGSRVSQLAIPFLVLSVGHSPTQAAAATAAELVPYVATQLFGSGVVLKFGLRRSCVVGNSVATLATVGLAISAQFGGGYALILATCCVIGISRGPADVAAQALIPHVSRASGTPLMRSTSLVEGASRTATIVGSPVAALLLIVVSPAAVISVTAAAFGIAAVTPLRIRSLPALSAEVQPGEPPVQILAGLKFLFADRPLRALARSVFLVNLADAGILGFLILMWSEQTFGNTAAAGVLLAVLSGAAIAGTVGLAACATSSRTRMVLIVAFLVAGCPRFIVMVTSQDLPVIVTVWVVAGLAAGLINPIFGYLQFRRIPEPQQPQVLGAVSGIGWIAIPIGTLAAGALVQTFGVDATLLIMGSIYLVAWLDMVVNPAWRTLTKESQMVAETLRSD
ncbi:MFS transporter [Rhodococcus sp. NPDC080181]|uniref:MFS transporter n=1 Tax=Rhodococcus sp. NPDC080181 TaxID=3155292 RepID=UPI00344FCA5A